MNEISKTFISLQEMKSPKINANEIITNSITVLEGNTNEDVYSNNEIFYLADSKNIILDFNDSYNGQYIVINENILEEDKMLNVMLQYPNELKNKLVCRYMVFDFRKLDESDNIEINFKNGDIKWLTNFPSQFKGGYFYLLYFQRFGSDLIVGNVFLQIKG